MAITTTPILLIIFLLFFPVSLFLFLALILRPRSIKIPIKGRHIFITGGSSGIGLAMAHRAASEGAHHVTILARNLNKLEEARDSIRASTGFDVNIAVADVRDFEAVQRAVNEAGPIDVLVCNQGVFMARELELQEQENIKLMIDVNLMGTFNLIKAALPGMKMNRSSRGPASIALMSSQAGQIGVYGYAAYSATKFGLRGLAEALHSELISDNIHVTVIFPPDTDTPGLSVDKKRRPEITRFMSKYTSAMTADEVAKKSLDGIKSGTFLVHCNFIGLLMCLANGSLSPQRSPWMAFAEVVSAGFLRIYALIMLWKFHETISSWKRSSSSSKRN